MEAKAPKFSFKKLLKWIGISLVILLGAVFLTVVISRIATSVRYGISGENSIDEGCYVDIGGQEQYILIRGEDTGNPVILWLHGGPASPDTYNNYIFDKDITQDYTLVYWDQRGCGRTYYRNADADPDNSTATAEQTQQDIGELTDYLCERFGQDKIILIGHSYGTAIGARYALKHPEKVAAYIGVGQLVTFDCEHYSYEDALAKAKANGDDTAAMEEAYKVFCDEKSIISMSALRGHTSPYHTSESESRCAINTTLWAIASPYMGIDDARWALKPMFGDINAFLGLNKKLFDYTMQVDITEYGMEYQIPVGFISGSNDWTTPAKYAEDYYNSVTAPEKQMQLIDGCGHFPQYEDTEAFNSALTKMLDDFLS